MEGQGTEDLFIHDNRRNVLFLPFCSPGLPGSISVQLTAMSRLLLTVLFTCTVCFFTIVTKDDSITRPNDFTLMSAMNQFKEYCLAFVV